MVERRFRLITPSEGKLPITRIFPLDVEELIARGDCRIAWVWLGRPQPKAREWRVVVISGEFPLEGLFGVAVRERGTSRLSSN